MFKLTTNFLLRISPIHVYLKTGKMTTISFAFQKDYAKVVVLYDSLLNFHLGDVDLFINAAKFMMKYIRDVDLARKTLFKGIRIHKRNKKLYLELFKVELDFAARKRKEAKEGKRKFYRRTRSVVCHIIKFAIF